MRRPLLTGCAFVLAVLAGCSSGSVAPSPSPIRAPTRATPLLPASRDIDAVASMRLRVTPEPDWALAAGGDVWVAGAGRGLAQFDATSGDAKGGLAIADICLAMDQGFGALWLATCTPGKARLLRVDLKTGRLLASIKLASAVEESSVGVGEGGVWLLAGDEPTRRLAMVNPRTNTVVRNAPAPEHAAGVRAGLGAVWVTTSASGTVVRVDPHTGKTVATITVAGGARFLAIGAGSVWVMNQDSGTVSRVDPATNRVVATITASESPIEGGDIAASDDAVWVRVNDVLATHIDPATNKVVDRLGPGSGSGSIAIADDSVWITAHDVTSVWRVPQP
jgi:virginiamycin B lyase